MKKLIVIGVLLGCLGCTTKEIRLWATYPIYAIDPTAGMVYDLTDIAVDVVAPFYEPGEVREDEQMDVPSR
jgi:hypothetical protein